MEMVGHIAWKYLEYYHILEYRFAQQVQNKFRTFFVCFFSPTNTQNLTPTTEILHGRPCEQCHSTASSTVEDQQSTDPYTN